MKLTEKANSSTDRPDTRATSSQAVENTEPYYTSIDLENPYHLYQSWSARYNFINTPVTYSKAYQHDLSITQLAIADQVTDKIFNFFSSCLYAYRDAMNQNIMKGVSRQGSSRHLELLSNLKAAGNDEAARQHLQGIDPYLKKLINEEVCAENSTLKKKVKDLTNRLFEVAEHSKTMRSKYLKELGTLRGAG